jgi:diguanylate cyclase (GGDEF)-like protein
MDNHSLEPGAFGDQLRHQLLDRIWVVAMLLAIVGTPASLSRALVTGWLHIYTFHLLLGLFVVCVFWFRHRFSYRVRSIVLLAIFFLIGAVGVLTLGLLGAGLWWLVVSSFLAGTLLSRKAGWMVSAASLGVLTLSAYLFTSGVTVYPVDANRYVVEPTSWISFLVAVSLLPFMVFHAISLFQESTQSLLQTVNQQRLELERMATHDQLTGLPLPNLAMDRLEVAIHAAQRSGRKVAVMFIDLDDFKRVNDTFGHEAGDHVLVELSARILRVLRGEDTAARIGGDEFIAILANVDSAQESGLVAQRIMEEVSQPFVWSGKSLRLGASIGVALYPDHAHDPLSLKREADAAMYSVKNAGKNGFAYAVHRQ